MAIQTFAPDIPSTTGKILTKREGLSAADTFTFVNNGRVEMRITAGATETKVKVKIQQKVDGLVVAEREIVVKETSKLVGPFEQSIYNNEEGKVEFTITSATAIVIELFE